MRVSVALAVALYGASVSAAPLRVGSKADTESVILGELCTRLLRASGVEAEYRRDLNGGTQVVWRALQRGDIDLYPEYTGTLARDLLHDPSLVTVAALRARLAPMGLGLSEPLGFANNYALGMSRDRAQALDTHRISDLVGHPELRLGFSHEFLDRPDGFPSLRARYGLPQTSVTGLDHDIEYRSLAEGSTDVVDLYTTDPEIEYHHLAVLDDDRRHFPTYESVVLYRANVPRAARDALARLAGRITQADMTRMNGRAKIYKDHEGLIAARFLRERLHVSAGDGLTGGRLHGVWARTVEHLTLVGVSLLLAVLAALPIGVVASRRVTFGQGVLGMLGVIRTVPSLALLVFMLPFLGTGTKPAVVALFLYSLLPIVRNTFTGLREIPTSLRESAEALGLSPWARLWRVELPLASRSILAGVKTAAVINVGTATLGAVIGGGGYGQPILTGIRRDDFAMILEGAIPAAALALVVQGLFELLERVVVPRGLRVRN